MDLISPFSADSLDIEKIKQIIKDDLIANDVITDISYEGSNISILTQILAYLTYTINATHAMNSNQTNLKLSQIRQNIIHAAQTIGYDITRKISSKMNVTFTNDGVNPDITIPKWTKFKCGDYFFYNTQNIEFSAGSLVATVDLIEGTYLDYTIDPTLRFTAETQMEYISLNYKNIENNNVYIRMKKKFSEDCTIYFTKVPSLVDVVNNKFNMFEEYEPETEFVKIWTSFGNQGNLIDIGDMVDIAILISSGKIANGILTCEFVTEQPGVTLSVNSASRGGSDEETNDSIKANAPLFYNTGLRTVSAADYNAYLIKSSLTDKVNSWGGETIKPMKLGHVFISSIPQDTNFRYLSSLEEVDLIKYLNEKPMVATGRIFKHPNYISIDIQVKIIGTVPNVDEKKTSIINTLQTYFEEYHNTFSTYIFQNKVIRLIEAVFDDNSQASVIVDIFPKLRLSKEIFTQTFDNGRWDIWIPNSPQKYYLVKGTDRIDYPTDEVDLYSYLLNGWTKEIQHEEDISVEFSGILNSKGITFPETTSSVTIDGIAYTARTLYLAGVEVGYFVPDLNILSLVDLTSELTVDGFVDITFSPEMNVKSEKSTVIELGSINFV